MGVLSFTESRIAFCATSEVELTELLRGGAVPGVAAASTAVV
jgi:hypothetical protein